MKNRILIVGGNSGIGEAIYEELLVNRTQDWDRIHRPSVQDMDVRNEESIELFLRQHGPFTHVVYTPGVARLAWASALTMNEYVNDFIVNAFGFGLVAGIHHRLYGGGVSYVAMVSDAMRVPMRGSTTYCASKAALAAIVKNLAREWAPQSRVNGIAPAIVDDTPMTHYIDSHVPDFRGWDREQAAAYEKSLLPMGRRITKEEVAHVTCDVLFGPQYQTGTIVDISGGK